MEMMMNKNKLEGYAVYKDSGVEWLGEIPKHWELIRFKYISNIKKGKLPKKITGEHSLQLPPYMSMDYLRGGAANQWVVDKSAKVIEEGEILLLWDGSNAGEFIKSRKGVISSTVALISYSNINSAFIWFYSKVIERELKEKTIGMGIPHVNGLTLKNLITLLPSIEEQAQIAAFLEKKCTKIDKVVQQKEQLIELLKERKQIIIQNAVTRGLNPNVKMKDSGVDWIGEIPEGWEAFANRVLFNQRNESGHENLPLLSVSIHSGVSSQELADEDNIRGRIKIQDKSSYKRVSTNDIVYNMMRAWQGAIGAVTIEGMVSPAYVVVSPNNKINATFFEYQYRTNDGIEQMNRLSKGITDFRKRLYWDEFKQIRTIVPPINEQKEIVCYIQTQSQKIDVAISLQTKQIKKLKEYKQVLINEVVTGKVKV